MTAPIALQLYSVREDLAKDFVGVMTQVADIGYIAVESMFALPGTTIEDAANLIRDLNLQVPSAHVPLPLGDDEKPVLECMAALGSKWIVSGRGPDSVKTPELIRQTCDLFNKAQRVAAENGLALAYHNHWWEFERVGDRFVYQLMLEYLDPEITFQIDTYWVQTAGVDPSAVVRELGPRAPLLHMKDGPAKKGVPQVAVGSGSVDVPSILSAAEGTAEWLIVELDECATDMIEAVAKSHQYLTAGGLAVGNKS